MNIDKDEAKVIIAMAAACYDEGIGPDYEDLLKRIRSEFGDEVFEDHPYLLTSYLDRLG